MTIHAFKDDKDGYYEVDLPAGTEMPEWTKSLVQCDRVIAVLLVPTEAEVRAERDARIESIRYRLERYNEQTLLGIPTTDSKETYILLLQYRQDLRDVTKQSGFPDKVIWPVMPA